MTQVCTYRLPCGWCDKHDKPCEVIECENTKQKQEEGLDIVQCDHDWVLHNRVTHTGGTDYHYHCRKCDVLKVVGFDGHIYESCEWQP